MQFYEEIWSYVETHKDQMISLSDSVWETPEVNYKEHRSAAAHKAVLKKQGFRISDRVAGIPTAFIGEAGAGSPIIAFLGEYDALAGLSQEAGIAEYSPRRAGAPGHGCGHNLLGAGAVLAATAIKTFIERSGISGRVRYYGCPAEEGGGAKAFMVRDGLFDDVDAAFSWHPMWFAGVFPAASLASLTIDFTFAGRSSHAAAAPELGRSALDAAELMNVGVNYMREHMPSSARVHYAYQDAGGCAPNVVPSKTIVRYMVRADELPQLSVLLDRVRRIAQGAALMTDTMVTERIITAMANLLPNDTLEAALQANLERLGPPLFDERDLDFARKIQATLIPADLETLKRMLGLQPDSDMPLCNFVVPLDPLRRTAGKGSTDVGDVSWKVPTVQAMGATCALGTALHSWQMVAQGKSDAAHKGFIHVAKAIAATASELIVNRKLLEMAKYEHKERIRHQPYVSLIPGDVEPPFEMSH